MKLGGFDRRTVNDSISFDLVFDQPKQPGHVDSF